MQWITAAFPALQNITPLSRGGQKLVFAATDSSGEDVVLKLIHPQEPPEGVQREILAVNRVQSSRVPRILNAGVINTPMGIPSIWIIEQRVVGDSLRERLRKGPLNVAEILKLMLHVLEALEKAERVQIVHRDVKPDNLMIDKNGDYWLLDFGIARHLTMAALTTASSPFGKFTLGYAPPEQFRNVQKDIDSRTDLFALGITVYECAQGKHPFTFNAPNQLEILQRVENSVLPPLDLPCKASASLNDLLSSMTQKRCSHRVSSVKEALIWIQEIISDESK